MRTPTNNTRKLRLLTPLFCSMTVLIAGQAFAGTPSVSLNADANRGNIAESGRVGYVGGSTRIGVSIDKNMQGQVDINQIVAEDDASATSVEGWFGYQIKDKNGSEKGVKGGGVKLNHLWADGDGRYQGDTVHKVFGAYDRDANDHAKVTAGYGQEQRDLFWSGHISKGISDKQGNGTGTATKAYDYGIGGEVGTFLEDSLTRIRGALDYEWGTDQADHEDKPTQATISAGVQQYFYDSPHSVTFDVSASKKSGGKSYGETTASNARLGYQYEFGKNGTFQSDRMTKRVRVEVPGTAAIAAIPAIPAIPGKAAQYSKKTISKPYIKLVKTTMKLENETFFKLNKATLTPSAKENLLKIAAEIRRSRYTGAIRITGNTCGLGSAKYDQILSERRARSVRKFLISEGFNPAHLIARGLGKAHPKYPNGPASGFKNRRVDIEYVTQRSVKKKMYRTEYKNVLVTAATSGTPGRAGIPGRAGTPARFIWKTEEVKTAPLWIKRALHNPIRHKRSVDTYQTSTVAPVVPVDDNFTLTSRDGMLDVLGNDGAGLTITQIVATPAHGKAVIVDGKIKYTANADYVGEDHFTYEVKDTYGKTQTAVVNIIVPKGAHNVAPIAVNDELTTYMDTAVSQDIIANDKDNDGDTLTLATITDPSFGTVSQNGNIITYTPEAGFSGTDIFTYTIFDGKGHEATATVTVIVKADTNKAPDAVNDAFSTDENTSITYDVLGNDTDADDDDLTISAKTDGAHGTVEIVDNKVKYTPEADYSGTDTFTYTISDGKGHTDTATVTVTIEEEEEENSDPEASDDSFTTYVNTEKSYDVLDNDHDDDGDTLTITDKTDGEHGTAEIINGKIKYMPESGYRGVDSFSYTISDGKGGTDTATVNVTIEGAPGNTAPEAVDDAVTTYVNIPMSYDVIDNDHDDDGDKLTISAKTDGEHGTVEIVDNKIKYIPESDYKGTDTFTYTISDGKGHSDTATVTVTIEDVTANQAPEAADDAFTTYVNTAMTYDVVDNDHDDDGDTLTISEKTDGSNGIVEIENNKIKYIPNTGYTGTDTFTYTISDGKDHTDTATVTVTIKAASGNIAPVATNDAFATEINTPKTYDVLGNDDDADGDSLIISTHSTPAHGSVTIVSNKIVYTPVTNYAGTDSFEYTISDNHGHTATATVNITIADPVLSPNYAATYGDTSITIPVLDDDTPRSTLVLTGSHSNPDHGTVSINTVNGTVTYTPEAGFTGTDTFTYEATNNKGFTGSAMVTVNVKASENRGAADDFIEIDINDAPVAHNIIDNDSASLKICGSITGNSGDSTVSISADKTSITYAANTYTGESDSFDYDVCDTDGNKVDDATVHIALSGFGGGANVAPVAISDTASVNGGGSVTIDVLANDTDADAGDTLELVGISTDGSHGHASINNGQIVYIADTDYSGNDTVTYVMTDNHGHYVYGTVTVTITMVVNSAPTISSIPAIDIVAGDYNTVDTNLALYFHDSDQGDTVYLANAYAASGELTFDGTTIWYTPKSGEASSEKPDTIHITVSDGKDDVTSTIKVNFN